MPPPTPVSHPTRGHLTGRAWQVYFLSLSSPADCKLQQGTGFILLLPAPSPGPGHRARCPQMAVACRHVQRVTPDCPAGARGTRANIGVETADREREINSQVSLVAAASGARRSRYRTLCPPGSHESGPRAPTHPWLLWRTSRPAPALVEHGPWTCWSLACVSALGLFIAQLASRACVRPPRAVRHSVSTGPAVASALCCE